MPVQVSYPGVYVQEVPSGVRTITGVSTSVALFIGMTNQGPLKVPTRVLSFAEFERVFGTDISSGQMTDQVRQFFLNGGQTAYIMRIAEGALAASSRLRDEANSADVLTLEARSAGTIGDTVRVDVDYDTSSPESTFNMTIFREEVDPAGVIQTVEFESFKELTMRPDVGNNVVSVLELQSRLVTAKVASSPPAPIQGFSIAGTLMSTTGTGVDELRNLITAADPLAVDAKGSFRIAVDDGAPVPVEISRPVDSTAPAVNAAITVPVNTRLAAVGKSVTVEVVTVGGFNILQFVSSASDGSVRITPAPTKDIAVGMQMGAGQGGLEVDGYAVQRPAPNGVFSVLGPLGPLPGLTALESFLGIDPNSVTDFTVNDSIDSTGLHTTSLPAWPGLAGATMVQGSFVGDQTNSLLNVRENLDYLVTEVNDASVIPWKANRHGFRMVLTPEFGGPDADITADVSTSGGTNLGVGGDILDNTPNVHRYRLGTGLPGIYQTGVQGGSNGTFPIAARYTEAFDEVDREVDLFNLMILPRASGQQDSDRIPVWQPASGFCQKRRAFLLVDPRSVWSDFNAVTDSSTGIANLRVGLVKDHAAVYWPGLTINAPEGGVRDIDPSGSIAGLMARIDSNRGVWKAPAGIEANLRGVRGVEHAMSDPENGVINPEAVNAIRVFPNGVVSWGARTMDGFDNSGNDDYKYVPVRRFALFIEESLFRGLKFAVFEPNDEPLWAQIRLAAGAFMNNLFRQGAFQGQKKSDAYFVKVDSETTTQNDINLGIVNVVIGFAPLKPAEFVIITIQQKAGQVQT